MNTLINDFVEGCKKELGNLLTGVYLHGSMTMGCFNPLKSDIDLIVIVNQEPSNDQKMKLMKTWVALNKQAPAKGLEISVVKKSYCKPFVYPTPFELHFSSMHLQWFESNPQDYIHKMNGTDSDLAAHFMIIKQYGITLFGEEIENVFGDVAEKDYWDSIWSDVEESREEIVENPIYITLNLCRVLAYAQEKEILSKEKGGQWGLSHVEEKYTEIIKEALSCYSSNQNMTVKEKLLIQFADYMIGRINTIKKPS